MINRINISSQLQVQGWLILFVLGVVSFFFMKPDFTFGVLVGGLMAMANFSLLQYAIQSAFAPTGSKRSKKKFIIITHYFKLAILGLIIYMLITKNWVDAVALTVGLSMVVINIIAMGIRLAIRTTSKEVI